MVFGGFMWAFWILLIAGIILLVYWIARHNRPGESEKKEDALDILKKRYARGEIYRTEFEEKKKDLLA